MPLWLAMAIPVVLLVVGALMWVLDYAKKAHELEKLRMEIRRLKAEEEERASRIAKPTQEEVERFGHHRGGPRLFPQRHFAAPPGCGAIVMSLSIISAILLLLLAAGEMIERLIRSLF